MALDVEIKRMVLNFTEDKRVKYVATAQRGRVVEPKKLVEQIHLRCGTNLSQINCVVSELVSAMSVYLNEGHGVRLEGFGTFLPSVVSRSSDNAEDAGVKRVKVTFLPSKALRTMVGEIGIYTDNGFSEAEKPEPDKPSDGGGQEFG